MGPQSLLHPCRGRSGGSRWSMVGHRRVSTPVMAAHHPSFWCRFVGSGLLVHHFKEWQLATWPNDHRWYITHKIFLRGFDSKTINDFWDRDHDHTGEVWRALVTAQSTPDMTAVLSPLMVEVYPHSWNSHSKRSASVGLEMFISKWRTSYRCCHQVNENKTTKQFCNNQ